MDCSMPDFPPCQASITNSQSLLRFMSINLVMPSNHLVLCYPLLLPPSIFPSIRVFSSESVSRIRWPKYYSFSLSISPSNEHSGLISFQIDWFDLLAVQGITVDFCCPLMPIAVDKRSLNIRESCGILSEGRSPCTITFSFFILFFVSVHQAGLCPFTLSHKSL